MIVCGFQNGTKLFETKYELVALAKHIFALFIAIVCDNERQKWVLLDEFQDCCVIYDSLSDLLANNNIVLLFAVYQQKGDVAETSSDLEPVLPEFNLIVIKTT